MQTNFSLAQLADPKTAESEKILRSCVHCGFCTATCPTYVLLGDELDSPRGRIYLIKDMLEGGKAATAEVVKHVDRCLSCLACMTTCPSGVHYMHLVDHARAHIEKTFRRPAADRLVRAVLARVLPNRRLFGLSLGLARLGRFAGRAIPAGTQFGRRLRAMLSLAPATRAETVSHDGVHPAAGVRRGRVALLAGCAQPVIAPEINAATIRLLTRMGVEVVVPKAVACCGALNHHMGYEHQAMGHARASIAAWHAEIEGEGLDAILVNTSGCGTTVKDYGHMFRDEPEPWASRARAVSERALDISEYLVRLGYAPSRPASGVRVAYHSACSLQHGQKVVSAPKDLLRAAGFKVVEPAEPHLCCGSAGTYNILQPEIAGRLRERKLGNLAAVRPELVAAGNIGCITQLAGGGMPVLHTVELLDWMAGGPEPAALAGAGGEASARQ
jgi:glycolate oxidase iron-sulfur subunit